MTGRLATLVLLATCIASLAAQRIQVIDPSKLPRFEAASVKPGDPAARVTSYDSAPGQYRLENGTLADVIVGAFGARRPDVAGAPEWVWLERFTVRARMPEGSRPPERMLMIRALLIDRFKLRYHAEPREEPGYRLTVARSDGRLGPGLRRSTAGCSVRRLAMQPVGDECRLNLGSGNVDALGLPTTTLASMVSIEVQRPVTLAPDLEGDFDIRLQWSPQPPGGPGITPDDQRRGGDGPTIYTALREQLGLKLEPETITVDRLVIDHIEHPDPD